MHRTYIYTFKRWNMIYKWQFWHQLRCEENTNVEQFSNTNWGSYNSPQFWQYLPTDSITSCKLRAQPFETAPLPFRSHIINPGCHCVSELPTKLLKGLINLLDPLTEFWEIFHLLDHQLIKKKKKKRYNSRTVLWYTGQVTGQGAQRFHVLRTPRTQHLHVFTSLEVLRIPSFQIFTEVSSHGNWLTESWYWWFNLQPPSSPGQRGVGLKVPTLH